MDINEKKRIKALLVEDDKICRYLTSNYLKDLGCEVDIAETALEAKNLITNHYYDIIFLDIGLPDKDGATLAYEIRNELKLNVPIVAVTGHALADQKQKYYDVGINDVLVKPATKQGFKEMLDLYVVESLT